MSQTIFDVPNTVVVVSVETPSVFEVDVFTDVTLGSSSNTADTLNLNPLLPGYGTTAQSAIEELVSSVDTWTSVTANVVTRTHSKYISINNTPNPIQFILPINAPLGFEFSVLASLGTHQITQNASQQIQFGNITTTNGSSGGIYSDTPGDYLKLVCIQSPNKWAVISAIGNLTFF